ncbi:MAG: hypothetical protein NT098_02225 [Candidatus Parcubacteria bacterium]|nr:hypothetical protein [Candidatus Parcubacteria bacterium]
MEISSFVTDNDGGFSSTFETSQALQGAFERIERMSAPLNFEETSLWNDGWGDFSDHIDCPAG